MDQQSISLNDATDIFRRRWPIAATVALVVFLATVVTAFTLENVYRSIGEVSVVEKDRRGVEPPPRKTLDLRIYELSDEVMARDNVIEAIEKFNLFPDERIDGSPGSVAGLVRQNFEVDLKRKEVDPTSRELGKVIGFTTTFYYKRPRTARDVAQFFQDKFIAAKDARRAEEAKATIEQFKIEAAGYRERLSAEEERLAQFKEENPGAMPDQVKWNMQQVESKRNRLAGIETSIRALEARIADLNRQLANTPPYAGSGDIDNQVAVLQAEFIRLIGIYTPDHPEVRRVRRQLETLLGAGSNFVVRQMLEVELRRELENLGTMTLGAEHPDRRAAVRRVEALRKEIDALPPDSPQTEEPNNPVYIGIALDLRAARRELGAQQTRAQSLDAEIRELEERVARAARVEQELQRILRGIDLLRDKLRSAEESLEMALTLVDRDPWETWTPTKPRMAFVPAFPNRPLYVILGAFIGLTLGIGAGLIKEALDSTIRGARDVRSVMQMPPIAAIPVIKTASDQRRDRLRLAAVATVVVVAVGAVGAYAHFQTTGMI